MLRSGGSEQAGYLLALGGLLVIVVATPVWAQPAPAADGSKTQDISIAEIEVRVFDRQKNAVVPLQESSDPYGMNVDAVLVVKVQGSWQGDASLVLKLTASAPKQSSEATGEVPPWKVTQSRTLAVLSENGQGATGASSKAGSERPHLTGRSRL